MDSGGEGWERGRRKEGIQTRTTGCTFVPSELIPSRSPGSMVGFSALRVCTVKPGCHWGYEAKSRSLKGRGLVFECSVPSFKVDYDSRFS
jgi:hypothetical protein